MVSVVNHTVYGSEANSYHNFVVTVDSKITISEGSYWRNNEVVFNSTSPLSFDIPAMPTDPAKFQDVFQTFIFITTSGIVMQKASEQIPGFVDRLVWFSLTPDFNSIQVEYTTMEMG